MTEKSIIGSLEERGNAVAESIFTSRLFERHSRGFILKTSILVRINVIGVNDESGRMIHHSSIRVVPRAYNSRPYCFFQ